MPANDPARGMIFNGLERDPAVCKTLFKVRGTNLCTHGPDPAPPGVDIKKSVPPVRAAVPIHDPATPPTGAVSPLAAECNGDGSSGLRTQVVYARSWDVPDRYALYLPSFRFWAEEADGIYNASAAETGGSRRIRFVHDASCEISVANVVMSPTGDDDLWNTINELAAQGYNRTDRKYMMFVDATVYCGIAPFFATDDRPGPDNPNNGGASYGRTDAGCWNGATAAHEHNHNLGGVQLTAPHTSGGGHCVDEWDLMCYSDEPNFPPLQFLCPDGAHNNRFDCNHDDYYSTNPPAWSWLRTHWNTADSLYLTGGQRWGYVWADNPTSPSYTPASAFQRNSSGAANTITRSAVGNYWVKFANLAGSGGTVNVTAYGSTTHYCKVGIWIPSGPDALVNVRCFTNAGAAADSLYTASFTQPTQDPGNFAYVWANEATNPSYTPSTAFQFNSTGGTNTITRSGVGTYAVTMPGLGGATGHVKVTGYGLDANTCKVASWGTSGSARVVNVACHTPAGAPVDAMFTATYTNQLSVLGVTGQAAGYVWANDPVSASYTPNTSYSFNSTGGAIGITRAGVGNYTVTFGSLGAFNGHVQVTAYGSSSERCKVNFWSGWGALQINVLCTNVAGTPVDTRFTASFTH